MSFIFRDVKISVRLRAPDKIAEVRDEETAELVDHMWVPQPDEVVDITPNLKHLEIEINRALERGQ